MLHKSLVMRPEQTLGRQHQNEHVLATSTFAYRRCPSFLPPDRISGIGSALDIGRRAKFHKVYFFVRAGLRAGEDP